MLSNFPFLSPPPGDGRSVCRCEETQLTYTYSCFMVHNDGPIFHLLSRTDQKFIFSAYRSQKYMLPNSCCNFISDWLIEQTFLYSGSLVSLSIYACEINTRLQVLVEEYYGLFNVFISMSLSVDVRAFRSGFCPSRWDPFRLEHTQVNVRQC